MTAGTTNHRITPSGLDDIDLATVREMIKHLPPPVVEELTPGQREALATRVWYGYNRAHRRFGRPGKRFRVGAMSRPLRPLSRMASRGR